MNPPTLLSPTKIQRIHEEFARTLLSVEDFAALHFGDVGSGLSRGHRLSAALRELERDYEKSIAALESAQHRLAKRARAARRTLRALPALPTFDSAGLSKLEADIAAAQQLLSKTDLDDLEALTRDEALQADALERRNALRRANLASAPALSSGAVQGSLSSFRQLKSSVTLSSPGKAVSTNEVTRQIQGLSEFIVERKKQLREKTQAIENLKFSYQRQKAGQEEDLRRMQERIQAMELEWTELVRIQADIEAVRETILMDVSALNGLRRQKERFTRQNFMAVHDRHNNSEAVKRLQKAREQYSGVAQRLEAKAQLLKQKEADLAERNLAVEHKKEEAHKYEVKVDEMESRLVTLGASFSGTLGQSQHELEILDLLASQRMSSTRSRTLEDELSMVLRDGEDDPLRQLED
jgi:hypothetical protein